MFKTYWVDSPKEMHRQGTLIAERKGHKGKRLLLIGHLDTVFPKESPFQTFKREGNIAKGPGVVDMKGGDIVILYALKALESVGALKDATITVALMGDEEDSGKPTSISRKALFAAAKNKDVALDFEGSFGLDTATIARRGISMWVIETEGNGTHSSSIFNKTAGDGAIFELVRILNTMRTSLSKEKGLTFNPGIILGGTSLTYDEKSAEGKAFGKHNVIAKKALTHGDLRFLSNPQKKRAENKMRSIVKHHLRGTKASIRFQDGIPAM